MPFGSLCAINGPVIKTSTEGWRIMKKCRRTRVAVSLVVFSLAAMLALPAVSMAQIHITKAASPEALTSGPGSVEYTYEVTNDSEQAPISGVTVTDDKLGVLPGPPTGDTNENERLDPGEMWTYTATANLAATTTNVVTVTGLEFGEVGVTDTATLTVTVTTESAPETPETPVTPTVEGGEIPETGSPWYDRLLLGAVLTFVGAAGLVVAARKSHA